MFAAPEGRQIKESVTIVCPLFFQITSNEDHITQSYVIFNKTDSGEYQRVAGVSNVTTTVFNITGLHPNRGYTFYVQPIADTVNGTKAECPGTSCRTKQAGMHITVFTLYA